MMTTMGAILGALPLAIGLGEGSETAPAAGHLHRGRAAAQPGADALHHAGGLSLSRPLAAVLPARLEPLVSRQMGQVTAAKTLRLLNSRSSGRFEPAQAVRACAVRRTCSRAMRTLRATLLAQATKSCAA